MGNFWRNSSTWASLPSLKLTATKTENWWLEDEFRLYEMPIFRGQLTVSFREWNSGTEFAFEKPFSLNFAQVSPWLYSPIPTFRNPKIEKTHPHPHIHTTHQHPHLRFVLWEALQDLGCRNTVYPTRRCFLWDHQWDILVSNMKAHAVQRIYIYLYNTLAHSSHVKCTGNIASGVAGHESTTYIILIFIYNHTPEPSKRWCLNSKGLPFWHPLPSVSRPLEGV